MAYKNPPLSEIYVKVYFEKNSLTTNEFFNIVPVLKKSGFPRVDIGGVFESPQSVVVRIGCWNDDKTLLVQLLPDILIFNQIGEYLGWREFKKFFDQNFKLLTDEIGQIKYRSILLGTIDKLTVSKQDFYLGKYLDCGGNKIPEWYQKASGAIDINLGRGFLEEENHNRQLEIKVRKQQEGFLINIVSVFHDKIIDPKEEIDKILERLHAESNESFESIITDITRNEIMGGLK